MWRPWKWRVQELDEGEKSSVAAPNISSMFQRKFRENFSPKHWIFSKFCHNFQNLSKNCNFKMLTKMKISESKVYVISQVIFEGQGNCSGWRRNIALSAKIRLKFWQNFGIISWLQNYTETTTLERRP